MRMIDGFSRACSLGNHERCDVNWCACPHHQHDEDDDPFPVEHPQLKSLSEAESERREARCE